MNTESQSMAGQAVSDERQLDGSRYLTIEAGDLGTSDGADGWQVALQLVLSREGELIEGELELAGRGGAWSGALVEETRVDSDTPLKLRARFGDPGATGDVRSLELTEGDEPGLFALELRSG